MPAAIVSRWAYRQLWSLLQIFGGYKDQVLKVLVTKRHGLYCSDTLQNNCDSRSLYLSLKHLIINSRTICENQKHGAMLDLLQALSDNLEKGNTCALEISKFAHEFDFSSDVVGNGYRSFLNIFCQCISECVSVLQKFTSGKGKSNLKELEAWCLTMDSVRAILEILIELRSKSDTGDLFSQESPVEILKHVDKVNLHGFYGSSAGFQYHKELRHMLKAISIGMASSSDAYHNKGSLLSKGLTYLNSGLFYAINDCRRAETIVKATKVADLTFFKGFYNSLDEGLLARVPHFLCPKMAVHQVISIPPLTLQVTSRDGIITEILPPTTKLGLKALECTVISPHAFQGMVMDWSEENHVQPPSKNLILHLHGGGFVACSSNFCQLFLRQWAIEAGCPILSVDYTLAPDAQFPRQVEEAFFAYCWALCNTHVLGTTAENVIISGDSAGGTLALGLALKCLQQGIRVPTGLLVMYAPVVVDFVPTPARILTLMDPIIPFGFLMKCLEAYAGENMPNYLLAQHYSQISNQSSKSDSAEVTTEGSIEISGDNKSTFQQDPILSPMFIEEDNLAKFPPLSIVTTTRDPCLDDCVEFAKKVRSAGGAVTLDILQDLPHAFLQFTPFSKSCFDGSLLCVRRAIEMLDMPS